MLRGDENCTKNSAMDHGNQRCVNVWRGRPRPRMLAFRSKAAGGAPAPHTQFVGYEAGGTYSLGGATPSPKKYCSICFTITAWSSRRAGLRRYSLSIILQNSVQAFHASSETLS